MVALLTANEIREIVDGTRIKPVDPASVDTKGWIRDDAKAMFLIASALETKQLEPLLVCVSAKQMWDNLCRIHKQKSASNKLLLLQKFHEYRMGPSDSVVQHIAKIKNLAAQIGDVGEVVSDLTVIAKILGSLAPKYSTLQTAWDSVDPARQNLENLEERLIREEARLGGEVENGTTALVAAKNDFKKKGKKPTKHVTCYRCGKKGHYAHSCRTKQSEKDGNCASSDCAFVGEVARSDRDAACGSVSSSGDSANELLASDQREVWLTDSGASQHVTNRRDWLSNYEPINNGGKVSLGDNKQCEIAGKGTVNIQKLVNGLWCDSKIDDVL